MCHIHQKKRGNCQKGLSDIDIYFWFCFVNNGEKFNNEEIRSLCENVDIRICTTAVESPLSNGIAERHNATLEFSVQKIMDDLKCDISLAVASAVSAKNALPQCSWFQPKPTSIWKKNNFGCFRKQQTPCFRRKDSK